MAHRAEEAKGSDPAQNSPVRDLVNLPVSTSCSRDSSLIVTRVRFVPVAESEPTAAKNHCNEKETEHAGDCGGREQRWILGLARVDDGLKSQTAAVAR